jgi:ribonucleoside-diphosphate reductase beta chain
MSDPVAQRKVEKFFDNCGSDKVSLAVFSGAGEGVSLYSSFAILLAFNKDGRFKGLTQIISWSCLDEAQHSEGGSELFRELVKETGITAEEIKEIADGFDSIIENEFSFLDNTFSRIDPSVVPISLAELKSYILLRANNRLSNLSLDIRIPMTGQETDLALKLSSWFEPVIRGQVNHDAFARAKAGDSYTSKPSQDFNSVDLSSLDLTPV